MKNKKLFAILTLVCFMFTLMPVAAFAATAEDSYVLTAKKDLKMTKGEAKDALEFAFDSNVTSNVYVWIEATANIPSTALDAVEDAAEVANTTGVYMMTATDAAKYVNDAAQMKIGSAGEYTLHAAMDDANGAVAAVLAEPSTSMTKAEKIAAIEEYELTSYSGYNTITVKATSASSSKYVADVAVDGASVATNVANGAKVTDATNGAYVVVPANSVDDKTITVTVKTSKDDATVIKGADVEIATSSNAIEVSDEALTTNVRGQIEFDVTGVTEGTYYVYVTVDGYEIRIEVVVTSYDAAYIETIKEPAAPFDVDTATLAGYVEFEITDINGNVLAGGFDGANNANVNTNGDYVKFIEKPADSDLENDDLTLVYYGEQYGYTVAANGGFDAEGTYTIKVILDNGKAATATFEVKEFQTPVMLMLAYEQEAVELDGIALVDKLLFVDANGVTTSAANDVELAATGYAIADFNDGKNDTLVTGKNQQTGDDEYALGAIQVEDDEKYVGSEIKVIAVSERYNMTATATIKVTADAAELAFASKTAEVNVNNKIDVQIVDANGAKVAPTNITKAEISYIVLDKPEGAKVSVTTASEANLKDKGTFTMALTSNKVGNVTVQVIAQVTIGSQGTEDNRAEQTKYYTGTQIFAVGTEGVGDVVVMSIGSNEIVINDAKATIDAAPIVENNRTFVPFRALAEAFGATVAYDEATQAVTAELNGVTVVMTIGSAEYTVNGEAKTADVAPFINGSRTMVPVRFAAEAFGIKVIPTYDENGATADILFNL